MHRGASLGFGGGRDERVDGVVPGGLAVLCGEGVGEADGVVVEFLGFFEFVHHEACYLFCSGLSVEVVHLGWVGLDVVEFPGIDVVVEVD